jgi:hypothetical protein
MDGKPQPRSPGGRRYTNQAVAIAILILLILAVAWYMYRRAAEQQKLGPPADCTSYPLAMRVPCMAGVAGCSMLEGERDQDACRAAVGACMSTAEAAMFEANLERPDKRAPRREKLNFHVAGFNRVAPHVPLCVNAIQKISPKGMANIANIAKSTIGVERAMPLDISRVLNDETTMGNIEALVDTVPGLTKWSLDVAKGWPSE